MADFLSGSWIVCEEPEFFGLMPGSKVHLSQCVSCSREFCPVKPKLFSAFFPEWIELSESPLNQKIVGLNRSLAKKRKLTQLYCPKKKTGIAGLRRTFEFLQIQSDMRCLQRENREEFHKIFEMEERDGLFRNVS